MKHFVVLAAISVTFFCQAVAGDVSGKVTFQGAPPKRARLQMSGDPACMNQHKEPVLSEEVIVNGNGTLKNVIVYVKEGLGDKKFNPPGQSAFLDQKGCIYTPHVLAVQTGQEVVIANDDATLHNVHSLSHDNPAFNRAQPMKGMKLPMKFEKPEIFKVKCEVHPWMGAYIGVFSNPFFAVTGDAGTFTLKGLPPGEYTVEAWHELYGTRELKIKVGKSGAATADFTFGSK